MKTDDSGRNCPMCGGPAHKGPKDEWACSESRRKEFAGLRADIAKITARAAAKNGS